MEWSIFLVVSSVIFIFIKSLYTCKCTHPNARKISWWLYHSLIQSLGNEFFYLLTPSLSAAGPDRPFWSPAFIMEALLNQAVLLERQRNKLVFRPPLWLRTVTLLSVYAAHWMKIALLWKANNLLESCPTSCWNLPHDVAGLFWFTQIIFCLVYRGRG